MRLTHDGSGPALQRASEGARGAMGDNEARRVLGAALPT